MTEGTKLQDREVVGARSAGTTAKGQAKLARPEAAAPMPSGSAPGYGFLLEANQQAFARWFHGFTSLSDEVTRFIQSRLQDDIAAWSVLASCRTPQEALQCQRRFAEKATAQYAEEITKLSQLMLKLATEGLGSFQRCAAPGSPSKGGRD